VAGKLMDVLRSFQSCPSRMPDNLDPPPSCLARHKIITRTPTPCDYTAPYATVGCSLCAQLCPKGSHTASFAPNHAWGISAQPTVPREHWTSGGKSSSLHCNLGPSILSAVVHVLRPSGFCGGDSVRHRPNAHFCALASRILCPWGLVTHPLVHSIHRFFVKLSAFHHNVCPATNCTGQYTIGTA
jgi:hypothetical protein